VFGASGPPPRPGSPVTTKSAFFGADASDVPPVELACAAAFARASAKICDLRASLAESLLAKFASASSFPPARAGAATALVNAAAKDVAMNARRSTSAAAPTASRRADAATTFALVRERVDLFRAETTTVEPTRADADVVRKCWNMALLCARETETTARMVVGVCTATKTVGWLELKLVTQHARHGAERSIRRRMTVWRDNYELKYN
jgi:hypothetical protein